MRVDPAVAADRPTGAASAETPTPVPAPRSAHPPLALGLLVQARPKQWAKNVLLLGAPGAAGVLTHADVLGRLALAILAFCLVASGTYFLNDAVDVESDRRHATKRTRPMAAGWVPVPLGVAVGIALLAGGLATAAVVGWQLLVVTAIYVATTTLYSFRLKREPVIELAAVAAGFVIRAIAGGIAARVELSEWFLLVASFGALFVVAGKRHGEFMHASESRVAATRPVLAQYTLPYLRFVWTVACGAAAASYALWAFEQATEARYPSLFQLSVLPFVLALLRYALLLERGQGGAPEDVILGDRVLGVLGVLWVVVFGLGVYLGR